MEARQIIDLKDYSEQLRVLDRLYELWDTVRDARADYYYVNVRREALGKLMLIETMPESVSPWMMSAVVVFPDRTTPRRSGGTPTRTAARPSVETSVRTSVK